jgi:hypothetical protein
MVNIPRASLVIVLCVFVDSNAVFRISALNYENRNRMISQCKHIKLS